LGLLENQCKLSIQAEMNIEDRNNIYFSSILIFVDHRLSTVITQIMIDQNMSMVELFMEIILFFFSNAYVATSDNLPVSSNEYNYCVPQ
jgi:hypothetical protein